MFSTQTLKKVIIIPAAAVGLLVPLTACVGGEPAASKELVAEQTLRVTTDPGAGACAQVDAPMLDIPTGDTEPQLRIPKPAGWERNTELENLDESMRFALANTATVADESPQHVAMVTLETMPNSEAQTIFDDFRAQLGDMLATKGLVMDVETTPGTVCGLPAETLTITNNAIGIGAGSAGRQGHPVTTLAVVAKACGQTYLITVTATSESDSAQVQRDVAMVLTGFEVLAPAAGQRV